MQIYCAGRSRPAARIYVPFHLTARLLYPVSYTLARVGLARPVPAPLDLGAMCDYLGFSFDGVAMQSSRPDRWVAGLCEQGALTRVLKIGRTGDPSLTNEARLLGELQVTLRGRLWVPQLLWSGNWRSHFVLATEAVPPAARRASLQDAVDLCNAMVGPVDDGNAIVHGDLAPWNVVRLDSHPVVLDWESARFARLPMFDLAHFVITGAALLGRTSAREAVEHLCGEDSPGQRHLEAVGEQRDRAAEFVLRYLDEAPPLGTKVMRFRDQVRGTLRAREPRDGTAAVRLETATGPAESRDGSGVTLSLADPPSARPNGRLRRSALEALADQGLSSLTNFATALLAARFAGPERFGKIAIALSVAFTAMMLGRAFVGEPLMAMIGDVSDRRRREVDGGALLT
ncbi:MAG: hypothetical protein M3P23_06970, partial [Actinomycetota bacterium]|nr:hypothetical protein [Actinomycetota bacterium]